MRAAAYRYIGASFPLLPVFVLFPGRKPSPSRAEQKSSRVPPRPLGALDGRALRHCLGSWAAFVLPRVGTSLLAQNEKGNQPLTPSVPFTILVKRCRDFNRFTSSSRMSRG